ncbi:hypothetical protein BKA70DRAFT_1386791, partial [Coprinopsis sp. MPI-PUGE-AT-0042]
FAGDTTSRTIKLLNDHSRLREEFEAVRKYFKGLSECDLPGCSATANLRACARLPRASKGRLIVTSQEPQA